MPVEQLGGTQPDAALFDLAECRVDCALITMLKEQPRLLLIGVDLAENRVLVFYGRSSRMLTIEDLVEVFETQAKTAEEPAKAKASVKNLE
ncbi:MAG: hypothetical protein P4L55_09610 [Syntrophobacteraceae bacterium]|nr:hypothetical protein [Syntrophobacteraceae bacterium]